MHFLLALLTCTAAFAATGLDTAIRIQDGNNSTNSKSSRVTITGLTNLHAGTLTASNNITAGNVLSVTGGARIIGALTNDAIVPLELVIGAPDKSLGSVAHGNSGEVLTSNGNGVAPSFQPASGGGGDTIWSTNVDGTIQATSSAVGNPLLNLLAGTTNAATVSSLAALNLGLTTTPTGYQTEGNGGLHIVSIKTLDGQNFADISVQAGPTADFSDFKDRGEIDFAAGGATTIGSDDAFSFLITAVYTGAGEQTRFAANINSPDDAEILLSVRNSQLTYMHPTAADGQTPYVWDTANTQSSGYLHKFNNHSTNKAGVMFNGAFQTSVPTGATNNQPFKVGDVATGIGLVLVATNYVQIEINGVLYKLGLVK